MATSDLLSLKAIQTWIWGDGLEEEEDGLGGFCTPLSGPGNALEMMVVEKDKNKAIFQGMKAD